MFRTKSPAIRETNKRRTYDGREVTFVSLDTQTDWDWVSDIEAGTNRTYDSESKIFFSKSHYREQIRFSINMPLFQSRQNATGIFQNTRQMREHIGKDWSIEKNTLEFMQ